MAAQGILKVISAAVRVSSALTQQHKMVHKVNPGGIKGAQDDWQLKGIYKVTESSPGNIKDNCA